MPSDRTPFLTDIYIASCAGLAATTGGIFALSIFGLVEVGFTGFSSQLFMLQLLYMVGAAAMIITSLFGVPIHRLAVTIGVAKRWRYVLGMFLLVLACHYLIVASVIGGRPDSTSVLVSPLRIYGDLIAWGAFLIPFAAILGGMTYHFLVHRAALIAPFGLSDLALVLVWLLPILWLMPVLVFTGEPMFSVHREPNPLHTRNEIVRNAAEYGVPIMTIVGLAALSIRAWSRQNANVVACISLIVPLGFLTVYSCETVGIGIDPLHFRRPGVLHALGIDAAHAAKWL